MTTIFRAFAALLPLFLAACLSQTSAPSDAPGGFTVTEGESRVVLNWDADPGLTYWVFYKVGNDVTKGDATAISYNVTAPAIISGLTNGTEYAFLIAASDDNSGTGPASAVETATPRLLSPDVDWTVGSPLFTNNTLRGITLGLNTYVAVGDAATVFFATRDYANPDGVTEDWWAEAATLPDGYSADLRAINYGDSLFVAIGADGSVISSTDADTWTARTAIGSAGMNALARSTSGTYIAVGNGGVIYKNTKSGITGATAWTAKTSGTGNDLYGVSYVNGGFVAVGEGGVLLTSADSGETWTARTSNTGNDLYQVAFGASTFVAVGDNGTIVSSVSSDASTWTLQDTPERSNVAITEHLRSICFGPDGQFIVVGTEGILVYSLTGANDTWSVGNAGSSDLNSIVPSDAFIAVGAAGAYVIGK